MQRELSRDYDLKYFLQRFRYTGPLRGGRDAEVAHGEDEFDAPVVKQPGKCAWSNGPIFHQNMK